MRDIIQIVDTPDRVTHLRHWGRRYPVVRVTEVTDQFGLWHTWVDLLVKDRLVRKTLWGRQAHLYKVMGHNHRE